MKKLTQEQMREIGNRYLHCQDRIGHCIKECNKCKWNYTETEVKQVMWNVLYSNDGKEA